MKTANALIMLSNSNNAGVTILDESITYQDLEGTKINVPRKLIVWLYDVMKEDFYRFSEDVSPEEAFKNYCEILSS